MLKITIQPDKVSTRLLLEGRLTGPWVEELNRCWEVAAALPQSRVTVDLAGVTFIDEQGKALLSRMWQQGAQLHAVGCLTRCIVDEITQSRGTDRAPSLPKECTKD